MSFIIEMKQDFKEINDNNIHRIENNEKLTMQLFGLDFEDNGDEQEKEKDFQLDFFNFKEKQFDLKSHLQTKQHQKYTRLVKSRRNEMNEMFDLMQIVTQGDLLPDDNNV